VALTRSMSAATRPTSASIEAFDGLSKGTITATQVSTFAQYALSLTYNRKCRLKRQGDDAVDRRGTALASGMAHYFDAFSFCEPVPTSLENATGGERKLRELVRTNDIVLVSAVGALLDGANIHHLVLDQNMSVIEGSLGMLPRRILVHEDDNREADD